MIRRSKVHFKPTIRGSQSQNSSQSSSQSAGQSTQAATSGASSPAKIIPPSATSVSSLPTPEPSPAEDVQASVSENTSNDVEISLERDEEQSSGTIQPSADAVASVIPPKDNLVFSDQELVESEVEASPVRATLQRQIGSSEEQAETLPSNLVSECPRSPVKKKHKSEVLEAKAPKGSKKSKEASKKSTGKTRKSAPKALDGLVDKSKLRMRDLLRYNPPMTKEQQAKRDAEQADQEKQTSICSNPPPADLSDAEPEEEEEEEEDHGLRVKLGANGEMILDEESCVIKRKKAPEGQTVFEDNQQVASSTTYASFRNGRNKTKCKWTEEETKTFYTALSVCGTDFTLMSSLFFKGKRTRVDLKKKYKKEEKFRMDVIDDVLAASDLTDLPDVDVLDKIASSSDEETESSEALVPL